MYLQEGTWPIPRFNLCYSGNSV